MLTRTLLTHSLCPWNVFTQKLQCTKKQQQNIQFQGVVIKDSMLNFLQTLPLIRGKVTCMHDQANRQRNKIGLKRLARTH